MKLKRRIAEGFRPFLWLLADAAVVGAIAWPAAALLLFLVNPELPFTPAGFFATMVAILPQALLVFVLAGPLLVLVGNAFAVGRSSTRGLRIRHVARFAFLDAFLLWLAAFDQWRVTGPLLPDATRAALAITVSALGAAWVIALALVVLDLRRPGSVRAPWLAALAVAVLVALAGAGDMRRVRFPDPVPIDVRGFAADRPLILFEVPGLSLEMLEGYAERGTAPALETLLKSGTVMTVDGGIVEEPLALHATLITGRGPEQHRLLAPLRYRPRLGGGGVSFGILPRGLLFWPSLQLGLWEAVPVTGGSLRAVSLSGVARALGLPVALVGDPLAGRPPNAESVIVPPDALRAGERIELGPAGSVTCASAGPLGERFFDPPAAELPGTRALEALVRSAMEADLCALETGRALLATGRFALVHVRLGGLERVARQFAGWQPGSAARGASDRELEAYGRVLARYIRQLDPAGGALASAGPPGALVALVSPHGVVPRQDLGRLLEALAGVSRPTASTDGPPPGALVLAGEGVVPEGHRAGAIALESVLPTLLWGAGLPAAADMGPIAIQAFTPEYVATHPVIGVPSYGKRR
ncbi:MAG: hypothetical protein MUF27_03000 [Acidobacteria bacterium]|jgi:hypothetical protein|nr:hypothetical protein [Acidobacteriota bacterium]